MRLSLLSGIEDQPGREKHEYPLTIGEIVVEAL